MGQKIKKLKIKWLTYAILGLIMIGFGVSLTGEAILLKLNSDSWKDWFFMGTLGLVVLNSGVSVFGQAVVYKCKLSEKD